MGNDLPEVVNTNRRLTLTKYTALALLVYHIPTGAAFLAKYMGLAKYEYEPISYVYLATLIVNALVLGTIQFKRQITRKFISVMLYTQVVACFFLMTTMFYVMGDLSYFALISCLLVLIFVFTQSPLYISVLCITSIALSFLCMSFIVQGRMSVTGSFGKDALLIYIFLPVSTFIAYMCSIVQKQHREIKQSRNKIKHTFVELEETHNTLEASNQRMIDSLHYAEMIQRSLLPGIDRMKTLSPDSLIIWFPKDIVGGDIFYTYTYKDNTLIAIMDCTGHGVPGAFLTLIAYTEIRKIILEDTCLDPAGILGRLNRSMKRVLYKNASKSLTDDGLDAAVVNINHTEKTIRYSGAHIPLFYIENNELTMIKGDKHSLGYLDSDEHFVFKNHTVHTSDDCSVYLKTDGYTDQLGGKKNLRFGTGRFKTLILANHQRPFGVQRKEFLRALFEYRGETEQRDDITVIGLKV